MKNTLSLLICIITLSSCLTSKSKFHLEISEIRKVTMTKSPWDIPMELDMKQTQKLVHELNINTPIGATKYMGHYWIEMHLSNDSILSLKCSDNIFSAGNSFAYEIREDDFFSIFWSEIDGNKKVWKLFTPVERSNTDEELHIYYNYKFSDKELSNISLVLNYYSIENKIVDNKIYYRGEDFDKELFWNYTIKSKDQSWLDNHKK